MGAFTAISTCLRKYATFSGRASRPEYWWFHGALVLGAIIFATLDLLLLDIDQLGGPFPIASFSIPFALITIFPGLAVGARRFQDFGWPGALFAVPFGLGYLFMFFPIQPVIDILLIMSMIVLLVGIRRSDPGPNKYGPNPHEVTP